jgi:hypothetical protein
MAKILQTTVSAWSLGKGNYDSSVTLIVEYSPDNAGPEINEATIVFGEPDTAEKLFGPLDREVNYIITVRKVKTS